MKISIRKFPIKFRIISIILLLFATFFSVFNITKCRLLPHITVRFEDLQPFHRHINVYYKGFKIGKTCRIKPSDDYRSTLIEFVIYPKNLKLPSNTTAILKKEKHFRTKIDYLELIYPENPAKNNLKNNAIISGKATIDAESYLASLDKNSLDNAKQQLEQASVNLNIMIEALSGIFTTVQEILNENRTNINTTLKNLSKSSENLRKTTENLNYAISKQRLTNTFTNIDSTTANLNDSTANFKIIAENTEQLSRALNSMMPQVETAMLETGCILKNLNDITCGIKNKLKTHFGGLRLFFGKTIENNNSAALLHKTSGH